MTVSSSRLTTRPVKGITLKQAVSKSSVRGGVYKDKNIVSVGGSIGKPGKNIGGTVGLDKGKPFGSVNVKGKVVAKFGPQGDNSTAAKKTAPARRAPIKRVNTTMTRIKKK